MMSSWCDVWKLTEAQVRIRAGAETCQCPESRHANTTIGISAFLNKETPSTTQLIQVTSCLCAYVLLCPVRVKSTFHYHLHDPREIK